MRKEIIIGRGVVTHVQDKMSTITSNIVKQGSTKVIKSPLRHTWASLLVGDLGDQVINEPGDIVPFDNVKIGDLAKPI